MNRAHLLGTAAWLAATQALANPQGGHVVQGSASISSPNANTLDVKQTSEDAVINWQSFSIGAGQTTQFQQPNAGAVTLDRVTGANLSQIAGTLRANGTVILINQSGIVFSQGAQVDTGGLIATTADITKPNFASGHLAFNKPSRVPGAAVINRGTITLAQAGLAALVAPSVANAGVISATLGRVVLGGAKTFTADLYGDGLVSFDVTSRVAEAPNSGALVSNTGQITADGGHILLTADAVDGIIGDLVDAGGTVQAQGVGGRAGTIALQGQGSGIVSVSGTLDASGQAAGQKGGTVSVLGNRIGLLAGASIDVSGQAGGGLVLVGGNFHGRGPQQRAQITYVDQAAHIAADGLGGSSGGSVAIWSDQQTAFYGTISARGGAMGGDGGYVEVSGENLDFGGIVDRSAPHGAAGTLLLDPAVVNIDDIAGTPNNNDLLPTILASEDPGATDHITVQGIESSLEGGNVSIAATGSINVNSAISNSTTFGFSLTLQAPTINVAADISNGFNGFGGNLSLLGSVVLASPSGTVNLSAGGNLTLGPMSGPDVLNLSAGGAANLSGAQVSSLSSSGVGELVLNAGTYSVTSGTLAFSSPAITSGTLTLGSSSTSFGSIILFTNTVLDATAGGGFVSVGSADATAAYAQDLTILAAGGGAEIAEAGTAEPLGTLSITGPATLGPQLDPSAVINAHRVLIPGPVLLNEDTIITTDATGTIVLGSVSSFASNGNSLSLSAGTGGITLNGVDVAALTDSSTGPVALNGGTYTIAGSPGGFTFGPVSTSGTLVFAQPMSFGAVTLTGDTVFEATGTGQIFDFTTLDSAGATPLSVAFLGTSIGNIDLRTIGGVNPVGALTVDIGGPALLGGNITAQSLAITSPVTLTAAITVDAPGGASFGTVDGFGTNFGVFGALNFTADSGNVTLGTVGGNIAINALTDASTASTVTLTGNVSAGSVDVPGAVALTGAIAIDTSGAAGITLGPVSGAASTLTLNAGAGPITLSGFTIAGFAETTTGVTTLNAGTYTTTGGPLDFGTVTTSGTLTLGSAATGFAALTLGAYTVLDATAAAGSVTIGNADATTSYGNGLTIMTGGTGSIVLNDAGTTTPLSSLTTIGDTVLGETSGQPVSLNARSVTIESPVTLLQPTTITTNAAGNISLAEVTGSATTPLVLSAGTGGIDLNGVSVESLSLGTPTGTVTLFSGTYTVLGSAAGYDFGNVTTNGSIVLGQPTSFGTVTLIGNTAFSFAAGASGNITLGPVSGSADLLSVDAGAGTLTLNGVQVAGLSLTAAGQVLDTGTYAILGSATGYDFGTVTTSGVLSFSQPTGFAGLTLAGDTTLDSSAANADLTLGPVAGGTRSLTLDAGSGSITLNGVTAGNFSATDASLTANTGTYDVPGGISFEGSSSNTTIFTNGTLTLLGGVAQFPFVRLQSDTTIIGQLIITGDTDATTAYGQGLTVQAGAGGEFVFGNVGTATPLRLLTSSSGTSYEANGTIIDAGSVSLLAEFVVAGLTTITTNAAGSIVLGDTTIDGGGGLALNAGSGGVTLNGASVNTLRIVSAGAVTLDTGLYQIGAGRAYSFGAVTTDGSLTLGQPTSFGAVTLGGDTVLDSSAVNGNITLGQVSSPTQTLTVNAGNGTVTLGGLQAAGFSETAAELILQTGTYTLTGEALDLGRVITGGTLTLGSTLTSFGTITLAADTVLDATAAGGGIIVGDAEATTAYGQSLQILVAQNGPNAGIRLDNAGLVAPLGTLTTAGPVFLGGGDSGPVSINADTVNIQNQATLNRSATITTDAGGSISLANVVGSDATGLTLSAGSGGISLNGVTAGSLAISATGTVTLNPTLYDILGNDGFYSFGNVTLQGVLQFAQPTGFGAVLLAGPTIISATPGCGCAFNFASIDSANPSSPQNATIVDQNISSLDIIGPVGATNPLGTLTIDIAGTTTLYGNVSSQQLAILSPLTLPFTITMDVPGGASLAAVDSSNSGTGAAGIGALSFTADTGNVTLSTVGANVPLASLADASASALTLTANVAAGAVSIAGPVALTAPVTIDTTSAASGAGPISLGQVTGTGFALSLTAGAGAISLAGFDVASFAETTTGATTLNGGSYTVASPTLAFGNVATSGDLIFGQPTSFGSVALLSDTTLDSSAVGGSLTLGQVTGGAALTVNTGSGGVTFDGVDVSALTVTGIGIETLQAGTYAIGTAAQFGTVQIGGDIILASPQTTIAAATLVADTTLDSSSVGGNLTLGPVSGPGQQLTLNAGTGTLTLNGVVVGGLIALAAGTETLNAGTYTIGSGPYVFGNVTTNGTIVLGQATGFGAITLASDTVLDTAPVSADMRFGAVTGQGFALEAVAGQGSVSAGAIDGVGSLVLAGGAVTLDGAIGGATPVGSVGIVSEGSGALSVSEPITATGSIALASSGDLAVTAPLRSILGDVAVIADAGGISLDSTIYAASTLNLQAATSIAETASGQIQANTLTLLAGGDAMLTGGNGIAALGNAQANSLALNDASALSVTGSVATIGSIVIDPQNAPLIVAASASLISQTGSIALATEGTSGDIFIQGLLQSPVAVSLASAGNSVEEGAGAIDALALTGSAGGLLALGGPNQIARLVAYKATGGLLVNDTISLEVPGAIASGGLLNLADAASLTIDKAASISGSVVALGAFGGALSISGTLAPAGDAYLATAGTLSLNAGGVINAGGTIRADAGGGASFAQGAALTAGGDVWIGYGASDIPGFARLGYTAPTSVTGDIAEAAAITAAGNVGLRASGSITAEAAITAGTAAAGGSLFLDTSSGTTGDILIGATLTATAGTGAGSGTVFISAAQNIDAAGALIGAVLVGQSGGWADFSGANRIASLGSFAASGEVPATDTTHPAGSSFAFTDDAPLTITAATYSTATPVSPPGLSTSGQLPSPLPTVTQTTASAAISGPGSLLLNAQGQPVSLIGSVSENAGSFIQIAGASLTQTGVLTLTAPLSLLDISGEPESAIAGLFGTNGAAGIAAFASGSPQNFLNSYETLVASEGVANPAALLKLGSLVAPLPGSHVVFAEDLGLLAGTITVPNLAIVSAGGSAALSGSIAGVSGQTGALLGRASFGATQLAFDPALTFDGCPIGAPDCGSITTTNTSIAGQFDFPLQPQIVTDVIDTGDTTGATFSETTSASGTTTTAEVLPNAGLFRLHALPLTTDMLGPENILRDRAFDDIDVDRLNTGREDVQ